MDERLGSLARFEDVEGVYRTEYIMVEDSWFQQGEALPVMVQYDGDRRGGLIRFSPNQDEVDVDSPHGCMTLRGNEFLAVLVWLIRQGLLEDVGLVSTETAPSVRATHASPVPVESAHATPDDQGTGELDYLWKREEMWASIRSEILPESGGEGDGEGGGGRGQRLVTMVADEASADDVGARHASPVQEVLDDDDPFGGEYDLVEGSGDPSWLELPTVMRHLHHDQELSVTDIARVCGTTYARVKGALKRLGIERRSYRGGRSKIAPHTESGCTAQ